MYRPKTTAAPLGQHLLTNPRVAEKVAEAAGAEKNVHVLEIGPGKGMLTRELLKRGTIVTAIEKDPNMVSVLHAEFEKEIKNKRETNRRIKEEKYFS